MGGDRRSSVIPWIDVAGRIDVLGGDRRSDGDVIPWVDVAGRIYRLRVFRRTVRPRRQPQVQHYSVYGGCQDSGRLLPRHCSSSNSAAGGPQNLDGDGGDRWYNVFRRLDVAVCIDVLGGDCRSNVILWVDVAGCIYTWRVFREIQVLTAGPALFFVSTGVAAATCCNALLGPRMNNVSHQRCCATSHDSAYYYFISTLWPLCHRAWALLSGLFWYIPVPRTSSAYFAQKTSGCARWSSGHL